MSQGPLQHVRVMGQECTRQRQPAGRIRGSEELRVLKLRYVSVKTQAIVLDPKVPLHPVGTHVSH